MFSMCHCWNRTPQGRGGCMRRTWRNWTPVTIAGNTRWKQFGTARSMRESQNRANYQASTIWCLEKGTQKKRIPGNQPQRSSTLGSSSARSTKTILTSRQRLLLPSTPRHRWLGQQPSSPPNESEDDQRKDVLRSASSEVTRKRRQGGIRVSAVLRARSRRVAGDLSPWRKERCRGACMVVAMAVRLLKNCIAPYSDQVPYHPSPLSSKSPLNKPLLSPSISVFPSLSSVQVGRFFHRR